jgi:hypothetical protein
MFLAPDSDELEIANAACIFFADAMPIERLHSRGSADLSPALRRSFGEMGWFSLAVPESDGGAGLSAVEQVLFFREVGRFCGPVDILAQTLAAALLVEPGTRQALLSGETGVALTVRDGETLRVFGGTDAIYGLLSGPEETRLLHSTKRGRTVLRLIRLAPCGCLHACRTVWCTKAVRERLGTPACCARRRCWSVLPKRRST